MKKKTDKEIVRILMDCPETSTTALAILRTVQFDGDPERAVARILESKEVPLPRDFPCSCACIKYGKAIASHILGYDANHLYRDEP